MRRAIESVISSSRRKVGGVHGVFFIPREWKEEAGSTVEAGSAVEEENEDILVASTDLTHVEKTRWVVLSGSFNPLHNGHTCLLEQGLATARSLPVIEGKVLIRGIFELAVSNVDKGLIDGDEVTRRVSPLQTFIKSSLMISHSSSFTDVERFGLVENDTIAPEA